MPVTERTPTRLVVAAGSTTLTLDKDAGKAVLQRKMLFWKQKPLELPRAVRIEFKPTAADIGSATHLVLQHLDFQRQCDIADLRNDPEGWFTFHHAVEPSYRFVVDTVNPRSGARSLRRALPQIQVA